MAAIWAGIDADLKLLTGRRMDLVAAIRRIGADRLETWLRNRHVLRADRLAETACRPPIVSTPACPGRS